MGMCDGGSGYSAILMTEYGGDKCPVAVFRQSQEACGELSAGADCSASKRRLIESKW